MSIVLALSIVVNILLLFILVGAYRESQDLQYEMRAATEYVAELERRKAEAALPTPSRTGMTGEAG